MIERKVRDNLLAIVAAYMDATGKSLSQVSKEFYGSSDFFEKLRRGEHSITVKRLDVMIAKFRRKWPRKADWPFVSAVWMTRERM